MSLPDKWESIVIVPTRDCNLSCNFCPVRKEKTYLSTPKIYEVVRFLSSLENRWKVRVKFQGGEPLLCWSTLSYLIKKCSFSNIQFVITTNGHLLNKDKIKFIMENKDRLELVVSIDEQKWDIRDREALFKKINTLRKMGFLKDCAFNITLSPYFQEELLNLLEKLKRLGVEDFRFFPAFHIFWKKEQLRLLSFSFKKIIEITGNILSSRIHYPKDKKGLKQFLLRSSSINKISPLVGNRLMIDSNGDIFSSDAFLLEFFAPWRKVFRIANIYDSNWRECLTYLKKDERAFKEIWKSVNLIYSWTASRTTQRINHALWMKYRFFSSRLADVLYSRINKTA